MIQEAQGQVKNMRPEITPSKPWTGQQRKTKNWLNGTTYVTSEEKRGLPYSKMKKRGGFPLSRGGKLKNAPKSRIKTGKGLKGVCEIDPKKRSEVPL